MKTTLLFFAILFTICAAANAQVPPAATVPGPNLNYIFRYSQTAEFGSSLGDWQTSSLSGSVDYQNGKQRLPFNLNYTGGYTWTLTGPTYTTGLFQRLLVSQGFNWRKWKVTVSDNVSYTPTAPTTGFSGIPGIGEPIGGPTPPSNPLILTLNTHIVYNNALGNAEHPLNYATTLSVGGGWNVLRYPDGNGLNINQELANVELTRRFNARNSIYGNYVFSEFSYPMYDFSFQTNTGFLGYKRSWNAKITSDISGGPEWKSSSDNGAIPSSISYAVKAMANYHYRFDSASLTFTRGANNGGGYLLGAETEMVTANYTREFGKNLNVGVTGDYTRLTGLSNNGVTESEFGGVQATRKIGRHFNAFANYTAINQSSSSAPPTLIGPLQPVILNNLLQVIGFGIGYSPRDTHLSQ